jgi:hypothetical protein
VALSPLVELGFVDVADGVGVGGWAPLIVLGRHRTQA